MPRSLTRDRRRIRRKRRTRLGVERLEQRRLLAAEVTITEFLASNDSSFLDGNGVSSDWIELHNSGDLAQDLAGWHLTDNPAELSRWTFPQSESVILAPGDYLVVFASGDNQLDPLGNFHTNFSIDAGGEYLALVRPDLEVASEFGTAQAPFATQRTNISYGIDRSVVAGDPQRYFLTPSPGAMNGEGVIGFVKDTQFSVDRGFFAETFSVDVSSATAGATLVYTIDGSVPTLDNGTQVFVGVDQPPVAAVTVTSTTTLRAAAFKTDYVPTNVDTQTYLFLEDVVVQPENPIGMPQAWGNAPAADYEMDPEITSDPAYEEDLLSGLRELPTISIVSDTAGVFGAGGIYSNPQNDSLEVPASVEYILPDGSSAFQVDAGLKVAGGASRNPNNSPKHSMSLRFRSEYGTARLAYPLFAESPVDEFNSLQLRAVYNNSWIHWDQGQRSRGTLIRDQFLRDSLIAAGHHDGGRGEYVHTYINGLYWGVFNLHERADAAHFAEYHGGDRQDYDALNGGTAIDGDINSWNNVKNVVASHDWGAIEEVLDVDNFIDWTLANVYGGNADLKTNGNWRAAGGGTAGAPWRLYSWDGERILEGSNARPPTALTDATGMLADLMQVPEFVVRLGDRIQKHFTANGIFTPDAASERFNDRVSQLTNAIVAESARWGDYRRDVHPRGETPLLYRRDQTWLPEIERLNTQFFPNRTSYLMGQFVTAGWLPSIASPRLLVAGSWSDGGVVAAGSTIQFEADADAVFYTLDGTDPRVEGGGISPQAIEYIPSVDSVSLVDAGSVWKYDDTGTDRGAHWRNPEFDDASWSSGPAQFGFGDGDEATVVSFGADASNKHRTTYFRKSFDLDDTDFTEMILRFRRDDGIAVYLNGVEIARDNLPAGTLTFSTLASRAAPDDGNDWIEIGVSPERFHQGNNTLAVEIHQNSPTSSDLSFDLELLGTQVTSPPIVLTESVDIAARARNENGDWSALRQSLFLIPNVPASTSNLRITEIHYNPVGDDGPEFIELHNITRGEAGVLVDLDGVTITDGPSLQFQIDPNTRLAPNEYALIVQDVAAFTAAYPNVDPAIIIGEFSGKLSNSGERVRVVDASGNELLDLTYETDFPWPEWADGLGGSLVLADPPNSLADRLGKPYQYRGSRFVDGSPGAQETPQLGILINEVIAHTDAPLSDAIELFNPTESPIDLSGWYLSDNGAVPTKYRIPTGTIIQPWDYLVFDESDFNPALPNQDSVQPFALSGSEGDSVWLFSGNGTSITGLADHTVFDATFNGVSLGRIDGSGNLLVPLASRSFGTHNGTFLSSSVVLSEIHYHPEVPSPSALAIRPDLTSKDLEFVELTNASTAEVDLKDWRVRGESDYDFAQPTVLNPGESILLVSFDPLSATEADRVAAFQSHYAIETSVRLLGPFTGSLSNSTGRVKLQAPDQPPAELPDLIPAVTVDQLVYDDRAPWPEDADGMGKSLQRVAVSTLGTYWDSWRGEDPTPGWMPARPTIQSVKINDGLAGRSVVTHVTVEFDSLVDLDVDGVRILHLGRNQAVGNLQVALSVVDDRSVATIQFGEDPLVAMHGGTTGSLIDGEYRLELTAKAIRAAGTDTALAHQYVFGTTDSDSFYRHFGDADGDGDNDALDFSALGRSLMSHLGDGRYDPQFDFDGDGDVDGIDSLHFANRYLTRRSR